MRLLPVKNGTPTDVSWSSAVPSSWPPCSLRRRCQWWRLRHRGATPSGAVDSGDAAWTISGRGSGDPEPLILGPWSWLFVDNADYLRVSATANAHCLQLFAVIWMGFVTIKCPTDHGASAVSI